MDSVGMVALDSLSGSLKRRIHRLLGSRVELIWIRGSELNPILGEFAWVEQVILDMALRARAALPYGGRLVVESANLELDAVAASSESLDPGRYVMVEMTCLRQAPTVITGDDSLSIDFSSEPWLESFLPESKDILQSL